jgi:membrane-bound serine protease (ClpP class)
MNAYAQNHLRRLRPAQRAGLKRFFTATLVAFGMGALVAAQPADEAPEPPPVERPIGPFEQAYVIPVKGEITDITRGSIERRVEQALEENIPLIVLELDTPGGALGVSLEICAMLKELRDDGLAVYAWVNRDAYSAGTIIGMATDGIYMARNATIGDSQPIMISPGGAMPIPEGIEAKAVSPLLAELRDSARRNGYPWDMVMALIRPEMVLYWVENTETGERRFIEPDERKELFGLSTSATRPADETDATATGPREGTESRTAWRDVESVPELETVPQPIVDARSLLTMRTPEAIAYGFALGTIHDLDELRAEFNVTGAITRLEITQMERFTAWLASPMVRSVLFLLMLLGAYAEFQTPGLGVPGAVALTALVLFLGAPYLAGYTMTWEIAIIVIGVLLLAVELFVIPGFGVAGILGFILIFAGVILSFIPPEPGRLPGDWFYLPTLPETYDYLRRGLISMTVGLTGALVGMVILARYLPRIPVAGRLVSPNPTHAQVQMDDYYEGKVAVGDVGVVEGSLRPAGKARFGENLLDVVSQGEYITNGQRVQVIERRGNRIVVRQAEEA